MVCSTSLMGPFTVYGGLSRPAVCFDDNGEVYCREVQEVSPSPTSSPTTNSTSDNQDNLSYKSDHRRDSIIYRLYI